MKSVGHHGDTEITRNHRSSRANGTLDETDKSIVSILRKDGRTAAMEIARQLDVSEATVRKRLQRLESERLLQIVATSSIHLLGYKQEMRILLKTTPGKTRAVIDQLKAIERVRYIALLGGSHNVELTVAFESDRTAARFLVDELAEVDGIIEYEATPVLRVVKRSYDWLAGDTDELHS